MFYTIGFAGVIFSIDVITADTSSLRDRGLAYAFTSSPYIITAFAGSAASERFYAYNWRWAYGSFAIILPIVAFPMFGLLQYNRYKAKRQGLLPKKEHNGRTFIQNIAFYAIELDRELRCRFIFMHLLISFISSGGLSSSDWSGAFPPSIHHFWVYSQ